MTSYRYIAVIDVAERYANGNATKKDQKAALMSARVVAWEASDPSVVSLATFKWDSVVALAAAWVAREVSREVARVAVWGVVREVRNTVRSAADLDATIVAQAEYLRKFCKPNFNL